MSHEENLSPAELKAQLEEIWNRPGVIGGRLSWHFNKFDPSKVEYRQHSVQEYLTPEQKARRKHLAMYNKAMRASVMSQAVQTIQDDGTTLYDFRSAPKAEPEHVTEAPAKPRRTRKAAKATIPAPVAVEAPVEAPEAIVEAEGPVKPEAAPVTDETIDLSYIYAAAKGRRDDIPKRPSFGVYYAKAKAMPNLTTLAIIGAFLAEIILKHA